MVIINAKAGFVYHNKVLQYLGMKNNNFFVSNFTFHVPIKLVAVKIK